MAGAPQRRHAGGFFSTGIAWLLGLILLIGVLPVAALDQVRLTTLSEVQLGNLPDKSPQDLRTIYHQLNLDYTASGFQLGLRSENFDSSEPGRNYNHLAQRFAYYRRGHLEVAAGHFFSIMGNGLLLHAFELPGVLTEARAARRRYQLTRDLDGLQVGYRWKGADIRLLRGTPVDSGTAPGLEGVERRAGTVQGGSIQLRPRGGLSGGIGVLQLKEDGVDELGATVHARLRLVHLLERLGIEGMVPELYGEYAQREVEMDRWFSLDRDLPRALYLAGTLAAGSWGLSLEYKDYRDFVVGGVNNPPTLIREHGAFLLNRDTHALLADDESGLQTELTYAFAGGQMLTANFTRAKRRLDPGEKDDMDLQEVFVQADSPVGATLQAQVWVDFSRDLIFKNERRKAVGSVWDWQLNEVYGLNADAQFQTVDRTFTFSLIHS